MASKISVLKRESKSFIDDVHIDGKHAGSIVSFNDSVDIYQFSLHASSIKGAIGDLDASGRTSLYDSIAASINHMANFQSEQEMMSKPAVVITFTDGKENESSNSKSDVQSAIDDIGFYPHNGCWHFIVPVGKKVNKSKLKSLCQNDHGEVVDDADSIHDLGTIFKALLIRVGKLAVEKGMVKKSGNKVEGKAIRKEVDYARIVPLAYILNLDISSSMSNSVLTVLIIQAVSRINYKNLFNIIVSK